MKPQRKKGSTGWAGIALLLAAGLVATQAYSASLPTTAQPLQNTGPNGALTYSADWSANASVVTRHESSALALNGSNQVTQVTVGGTKASGGVKANVTLKDKDGVTLDSGSAVFSGAAGAYTQAVTLTAGTILYSKVATASAVYPAPTTAQLGAAADSYVDQTNSASNYGTSTSMYVRSRSSSRNWRSFARFDVSTIPAGSIVSSATLTLCATAVPAAARTYNAHRVTASWVETTITWSVQPAVAASPTASATTPASASCMTWTVTADVQAWVDGTANNGWRVSDSVESSATAYSTTYATRENATVGNRPKLDVSYVAP